MTYKHKGCIKFDVNIHRPRQSRGNEKDKLLSRVEPRCSDLQSSTPDTEPQSPNKSLSPSNLTRSTKSIEDVAWKIYSSLTQLNQGDSCIHFSAERLLVCFQLLSTSLVRISRTHEI